MSVRALPLAGLTLMMACGPSVTTQTNPAIPVPAGATYEWVGTANVNGNDPVVSNEIVQAQIQTAIEAQMAAKGYKKVANDPNALFYVRYYLGTKTQTSYMTTSMGVGGPGYGYGWGGYYGGGRHHHAADRDHPGQCDRGPGPDGHQHAGVARHHDGRHEQQGADPGADQQCHQDGDGRPASRGWRAAEEVADWGWQPNGPAHHARARSAFRVSSRLVSAPLVSAPLVSDGLARVESAGATPSG